MKQEGLYHLQNKRLFSERTSLFPSDTLHEKCSYSELFGPYFPGFGLITERYYVSLRIQSEYGKMRIRITPNTDTFYAVTTRREKTYLRNKSK